MPSGDLPVTILFWVASLTIVVAQLMILRSTRRAQRTASAPTSLTEWSFAIVPALLLVLLLLVTWREARRGPVMDVTFPPVAGVIHS